jgi:hypothetical protein
MNTFFGGFPAIVKQSDLETKQTLLKNLVRTYLEKDVSFFFNLKEIEKFRSLLSNLSICIGSLSPSFLYMKSIPYPPINYCLKLINKHIAQKKRI